MPRDRRSQAHLVAPSRARRRGTPPGARGIAVAAVCGLALSGCLDNSPDAVELSNMRPWYKIPLSSPTAFVGSFARYCVAPLDSGEPFDSVLRKASFVPVSKESRTGSRIYLVDDTRPAVLVNDKPGARSCGVVAMARAGQTQRVADAVPRLFPDARPADPALVPGAERVWVETGARTRVIFTSRDANKPRWSEYRLAVTETRP